MPKLAQPMAFRYESDLVACGVALLPAFISARASNWKIATELGVGLAIADLVVALFKRPVGANVRALSARESVVLAALRNRGTTRIDLLEAGCGLERGGLRGPTLDRLVKNGLVERLPGGCVALAGDWAEEVELIAIEAKLVKWKQALRQASNYGRYADSVYVLLPSSEARRAACIEAATMAGIGLLIVEDGQLEEHVAPAKFVNHDWRREFALSRVLAPS